MNTPIAVVRDRVYVQISVWTLPTVFELESSFHRVMLTNSKAKASRIIAVSLHNPDYYLFTRSYTQELTTWPNGWCYEVNHAWKNALTKRLIPKLFSFFLPRIYVWGRPEILRGGQEFFTPPRGGGKIFDPQLRGGLDFFLPLFRGPGYFFCVCLLCYDLFPLKMLKYAFF